MANNGHPSHEPVSETEAAAPMVSVIIPHLNQPALLEHCLQSVTQQSYPRDRYEVIVVDNGSSAPIDGIIGRFDGVRGYQELEPGAGLARNRGVAEAQGDIFVFIDADCVAKRDWIEQAVHALHHDPAVKIVGGDVRILTQEPDKMNALEAYESVFHYRQKRYIEKENYSGTGNLAVTRDVFEAVGPFCGIEKAEDHDWGVRATGLGYRILYWPAMVIYHPARKDLSELFLKWNRHIQHAQERYARQRFPTLKWLTYTGAVGASAVFDFLTVARSDRIHGLSTKLGAGTVLFKIRTYRFFKMALISLNIKKLSKVEWNR